MPDALVATISALSVGVRRIERRLDGPGAGPSIGEAGALLELHRGLLLSALELRAELLAAGVVVDLPADVADALGVPLDPAELCEQGWCGGRPIGPHGTPSSGVYKSSCPDCEGAMLALITVETSQMNGDTP